MHNIFDLKYRSTTKKHASYAHNPESLHTYGRIIEGKERVSHAFRIRTNRLMIAQPEIQKQHKNIHTQSERHRERERESEQNNNNNDKVIIIHRVITNLRAK